MASVFLVWVDYEQCEAFGSLEDAENFCYNTYGPDKKKWAGIDERSLGAVPRKQIKEYVAIAWWPAWEYQAPPKQPYVATEYGKKPYVSADDGADKHAPRFEGRGRTEHAAEKAARDLARKEPPRYEYAQSSATTAGVLPIYKRADYTGRVGSW